MRRRRLPVAMVIAGTGALLVSITGMVTAHGEESLGGYTLVARAPGVEFTEDQPNAQVHPEGQGTIGEATSELSTSSSYALSAIAWPGPLVANAGTLLIVASNGDVPQEASAIRDPVRAEARSGQTEEDVSFDQAPGTTMKAHSSERRAAAQALIDESGVPAVLELGSIKSESEATAEGASAISTASSRISDISFAGAIEIGSVTSTAKAVTTAAGTKVDGETLVGDLSIGGHPARIDGDGITFEDQGAPTDPLAPVTDAVSEQILSQMGVTVAVSQPHVEEVDGLTTYTAGSVVFVWEPPNNDSHNVFTMTLGGATVTAGAVEGFDVGDFDLPPTPGPTTEPTVPAEPGGGDTTADAGTGSVSSLDDVSVSDDGSADVSDPGTGSGGDDTASGDFESGPLFDSSPIALFEGIGALYGLLALIGAGLLATGLRKLADGALLTSTVVCDLERELS